jgi:hypothetical protein
VNNQVGTKFAKQLFDIILAREVEIFTAGHRYPAASDLPQSLHNVGAKEAGAPGNQDALGCQILSHIFDRFRRFIDSTRRQP